MFSCTLQAIDYIQQDINKQLDDYLSVDTVITDRSKVTQQVKVQYMECSYFSNLLVVMQYPASNTAVLCYNICNTNYSVNLKTVSNLEATLRIDGVNSQENFWSFVTSSTVSYHFKPCTSSLYGVKNSFCMNPSE